MKWYYDLHVSDEETRQQREAKWHVRPYSEWETVNSGNKTLFSLTEREKWTPKVVQNLCHVNLPLFPPYFSPRKFLPIRCWYFKRLLLNLVIFLEVVFFIPWGPCLSFSWGVLSRWRWGVRQHAWSLSVRWEKLDPSPLVAGVHPMTKLWQQKCLWTLPMSLGENSPYWESMLEEENRGARINTGNTPWNKSGEWREHPSPVVRPRSRVCWDLTVHTISREARGGLGTRDGTAIGWWP